MKNLFLFLFLIPILMTGCEPWGGGAGYQYLGRLNIAQINCDAEGSYTTSLTINNDVFKVIGKVEFRKALHYSFVWVNLSKNVLRLREGRRSFEYSLLE